MILRAPFTSRGVKETLHCEGVSLAQLARQYGTPLYVYSASSIRERFQVLDDAFAKIPHSICYSVKANPNLSILKLLAKSGAGFDVVSGGELERVLRADKKAAAKVVFSGVGKTTEEMDAALRAGILLFNLESEPEMELLASRAAQLRTRAQIAFRVNPDVPAETHPYISTGLREHKFGVPIRSARELYRKAARHKELQFAGISVHIGSQITDLRPFTATMKRVARLMQQLRDDGHDIDYLDAGGGLGIDYFRSQKNDFTAIAQKYAQAILKPLAGECDHLLLEPGRSLVGRAGVLLMRVLYRKQNGRKRFLVVDAGMNDLIRPSLYNAHHEIVPVSRRSGRKLETVDVVGPICESGDFLARDRKLPRMEEGELLAIRDVGAYGMSLASNYNSRPRAAEVLVDGKMVKVIRRRETIKGMLEEEL
jgi:diaminopimelate decarboxylase